jgi:hypothetical protein
VVPALERSLILDEARRRALRDAPAHMTHHSITHALRDAPDVRGWPREEIIWERERGREGERGGGGRESESARAYVCVCAYVCVHAPVLDHGAAANIVGLAAGPKGHRGSRRHGARNQPGWPVFIQLYRFTVTTTVQVYCYYYCTN